jgi:hypothetical protein
MSAGHNKLPNLNFYVNHQFKLKLPLKVAATPAWIESE